MVASGIKILFSIIVFINVGIYSVLGGVTGSNVDGVYSPGSLLYRFYLFQKSLGTIDFPESAPLDMEYVKEKLPNVIKNFKPNELGSIPVVMYHNLVETEEEEGYYARSYANFRKDLKMLLDDGYVPINMDEWIEGTFSVPAGKTPVVLTFDDGHSTDIQLDENGKPTEECVVGIIESVLKDYPDIAPKATFYLNGPNAFGDHGYDPEKIAYLQEHGYEIANHTTTHANISEISLEDAREEIISQAKRLEEYTGKKSFNFAVPFGEKFDDYENKIRAGFLGEYTMKSSVNVGWSPTTSIYSINFDPLDINRITCGSDDYELDFWIDDLKNNPEKRYISDGIDLHVTVPKSRVDDLDRARLEKSGVQITVYDDDTNEISD